MLVVVATCLQHTAFLLVESFFGSHEMKDKRAANRSEQPVVQVCEVVAGGRARVLPDHNTATQNNQVLAAAQPEKLNAADCKAHTHTLGHFGTTVGTL